MEFIIVNILKAFRPDLVPPGTGAEPQAGASSEQDMPLGPKGDPRPVGMLLLIAGPNREGRAGRPVGARSAGRARGGRVGSRPEPGPCRAGEAERSVCACV